MDKKIIPSVIMIRPKDANNSLVHDLCISLTLKTSYKNNYTFVLTNSSIKNGFYTITKDQIIKEAYEENSLYIMDYSNIEYVFNYEILIEIENSKEIQQILDNYTIFNIEHSKGYIDAIKKCLIKTKELENKGSFFDLKIDYRILPENQFKIEINQNKKI